MTWYIYKIAPLQFDWPLLDSTYRKLGVMIPDVVLSAAERRLGWDGHFDDGPGAFVFPDPAVGGCWQAYAWTSDESGASYIACQRKLDWLHDQASGMIELQA